MIDGTVRLVLRSGPVGFEWSYPSGSGLRAERKAMEENQEIIRNSEPGNWIPYYIVTDADGDVIDEDTLFDCERASHPEEFSGLNMLSVMTIDLLGGLDVTDSMGLLATADTIYASADSLYVTTQNWNTWLWAQQGGGDREPKSVTTDIHKFDISNVRVTQYEASGVVEDISSTSSRWTSTRSAPRGVDNPTQLVGKAASNPNPLSLSLSRATTS